MKHVFLPSFFQQVLTESIARAAELSRNGLHGYDRVGWTAETDRRHIEPLNAELYLDGHEGGGSGQKTTGAALVRGGSSGRHTQRRSERTSAAPASDTSTATVDVVDGRRPYRLKKGNENDERTRLNNRRVAEEDEGAATGHAPGLEVDDEKKHEVQAPSTSTGNTPLVPSFCAVEAFERYAAVHQAITEGKELQR